MACSRWSRTVTRSCSTCRAACCSWTCRRRNWSAAPRRRRSPSVRVPGPRLGAPVRRPCPTGRHRRRPRLPGRRERTWGRPGVPLTAPACNWSGSTSAARPAGRSALGGDAPLRVGPGRAAATILEQARAAVESAGAAADLGGTLLAPVRVPGGLGCRRHLRAEPRRPHRGVDRGRRLRPDLRRPATGGVLQGNGTAGGRGRASRSASAPTRPGTRRSPSSAWCSTPPVRSSATSSATT